MSRMRSSRSGGALNPFAIEWVRFASGERLPLLTRRIDGLPIEAPAYWIASNERPLNKAAATLEKRLRHLMSLYLWAASRGTTPEQVVRSSAFMTLEQLNDLDRFCRLSLADAVATVCNPTEEEGNVTSMRSSTPSGRSVGASQADVGNRLAAIHSFLEYESYSHLSRMARGGAQRNGYEQNRNFILGIMRERARSFQPVPTTHTLKEGLSPEGRTALLALIEVGAPGNPWLPHVQERNKFIVQLMYELGLRRGEVLCLRVEDVKLTADGGFLRIMRRPQDNADPRRSKPQVKTLGRELAISPGLRDVFVSYLRLRRKIGGARKHSFLFVDSVYGVPLGVSSITKLFKRLRAADATLSSLTAHTLRHDWNDRFSELSDRAAPRRTAVDARNEERIRAYAMGWSNEATAAQYTRRWIREAANKRILQMQNERDFEID